MCKHWYCKRSTGVGKSTFSLLGSVPNIPKQHEEVIQSLLMLAKKAIMMKWVGDDPPSIFMWKSLISEVVTLEKWGHYINGRIHT